MGTGKTGGAWLLPLVDLVVAGAAPRVAAAALLVGAHWVAGAGLVNDGVAATKAHLRWGGRGGEGYSRVGPVAAASGGKQHVGEVTAASASLNSLKAATKEKLKGHEEKKILKKKNKN